MRSIEPMYEEYWDDGREEFVATGELIGYRVVSSLGAVIGEGETREEALAKAHEHDLLFV